MVQQIGELLRSVERQPKSSGDVWKDIAKSVDGMDFSVYVQLMQDFWEAQGRKPPGDTLLKMWYITLRNMTPDQLGLAILRYLETAADQYCTPKLLLELGGVTVADDTASVSAWDEVISEIKRVGGYQTPKFTDSRTAATIRHLGGWVLVCDTPQEELHKWTRQNFERTFSAMPKTATARLTNLIEITNAQTGQTQAATAITKQIEADRAKRLED